jgi:hypothetical protein
MNRDSTNLFTFLIIGFALFGVLLVAFIESEVIASELAISLAFLVNIIAIYNKSFSKIKNKIRCFSASFLFGALLSIIFV